MGFFSRNTSITECMIGLVKGGITFPKENTALYLCFKMLLNLFYKMKNLKDVPTKVHQSPIAFMLRQYFYLKFLSVINKVENN